MKKWFFPFAFTLYFVWVVGLALILSIEIPQLDPIEQQKLKEGKTFWEWDSPYGILSTHYIEKGTGDQHILFIHGFRAYSYTWRHLMDPLAQAGYHVWAIDLIGYGLSDKPFHAPYHVDFFVEQIDAFMKAKGISQAHIVGNSLGGGLALLVAMAHPQQVHSLTLISALGYPLNLPLYLAVGPYLNYPNLWVPLLCPTMIRKGLQQIIYKQDRVTDEIVEAFSLPYRFPGGIESTLQTLSQFDNKRLAEMAENYSTLTTVPTLVVWGDQDSLIPVDHFKKFSQDFQNSQCLLIPNCGHIPQEEDPDEVLNALLHFLETKAKY